MTKLSEIYYSPTPKKWRRAGDFALILIPTIKLAVATSPEGMLSPAFIWFLENILEIVLVGFKFWTNTQKENEL